MTRMAKLITNSVQSVSCTFNIAKQVWQIRTEMRLGETFQLENLFWTLIVNL